MKADNDEDKKLLTHHEQLPLCTTRLAYRQGRKLTAVKVYTVNNESNHLLVFGVPSLNLGQEAKALFLKFGKLLHFNISTTHPAEAFTETYHAKYERIQSARIAKKMTDTKNFYGGSLHVCYAPEFESIEETKLKLNQRKKDVMLRLINLQKEATDTNNSNLEEKLDDHSEINTDSDCYQTHEEIVNEVSCNESHHYTHNTRKVKKKLNMGERNIIYVNHKRKFSKDVVIEKRFNPYLDHTRTTENKSSIKNVTSPSNIEVVDCTSADKEIVSNINEGLNYNKFGNEIIKKIDPKPLNRIIFNCNKKS